MTLAIVVGLLTVEAMRVFPFGTRRRFPADRGKAWKRHILKPSSARPNEARMSALPLPRIITDEQINKIVDGLRKVLSV